MGLHQAGGRGWWGKKCTAARVEYPSAHDWHAPLAQAFPLALLMHVPSTGWLLLSALRAVISHASIAAAPPQAVGSSQALVQVRLASSPLGL